MAKLPFFKFDAESWLTGKVQVLNVEQIGIYANLMACVWRDGGSVENSRFLPRMLGCTEEQWQEALTDFLELGIVYEGDAKCLKIKFLDEQITAHGDEKYTRIVERNRQNGARVGRPRKARETEKPNGFDGNPENPVGFLGNQENPENPKKPTTTTTTTTNEISLTRDNAHAPDAFGSCFIPYPLKAADVVAEATRQGKPMTEQQAQAFMDYYSATGWTIRGARITDWRHKVGNWCDRQREIDARQKAQPLPQLTVTRQTGVMTRKQDYGKGQRGYQGD